MTANVSNQSISQNVLCAPRYHVSFLVGRVVGALVIPGLYPSIKRVDYSCLWCIFDMSLKNRQKYNHT